MIPWILIILGVIAIFTLVKMKYIKHKIVVVILILFLGTLYLGYVMTISKANIDWTTSEGVETAVKLYFTWFAHAFTNMQSITANVIKMDWKGNSTTNNLPVLEEELTKNKYFK